MNSAIKNGRVSGLWAIALGILIACSKQVPVPDAIGPTPSNEQLEWHRMEMNAFVHFSINTFTNKEWGYGDESPALFNPTAFDANQWARVFSEAGFKGVILTCKHHDGFCLWPSEHTNHSVKNSPFRDGKGDVVQELAEACKKYGLKFGIYVSPWDRNHADYGRPAYLTYYRNQLTELFNDYGPIFEMWFDGANGGDGHYGGANEQRRIDGSTYYQWPVTLDLVKSYNPEIIFFSDAGPGVRWVGNEKGIAGETNWNTITPDTLFAGKAGIEPLLNRGSEDGTHWIPAEVDVSIRKGWFYHPEEDSLVKSPAQLFNIYLTSVGRGSTLLLNIPPDRRGLIHENDVRSLQGFRKMLDSVFSENLAQAGVVSASSYRGSDQRFDASKLIDRDDQTYWSTDDDVIRSSIEVAWSEPQSISYLVIQEFIELGQRIRQFKVDAMIDGQWQDVFNGTTIGYKRIVPLGHVRTSQLRLRITDAKACPVISDLEVY